MSALERPELRGIRVLVVDDDADNREMLALVLEHSGAAVATAECAEEALRAVERDPPQVLISDIGLPDQDGYSLLRRVRALSRRGPSIPAIALTGYGKHDDRRPPGPEAFEMHLTKPVAPEQMLEAIVHVLQRR
jgi:CheY-like chemotaxis protein